MVGGDYGNSYISAGRVVGWRAGLMHASNMSVLLLVFIHRSMNTQSSCKIRLLLNWVCHMTISIYELCQYVCLNTYVQFYI